MGRASGKLHKAVAEKLRQRLWRRGAAEKQEALVRAAAVKHLRKEFGKKQPPPTDTLRQKLQKACRCHSTMPEGRHEEKCHFEPSNMRRSLHSHMASGASIEQQLHTRTSSGASGSHYTFPEKRAVTLERCLRTLFNTLFERCLAILRPGAQI